MVTNNYVSSDIELIVMEAAREAVKKDMEEITESLLLESISNTTPSISQEVLLYYEKFKNLERT